MAGRGRAPKPVEERRNTSAPRRGEWLEISAPTVSAPALPEGEWHPRAAGSWGLWWSDPAATQWTDGQYSEVVELLALTHEFWMGNTTRAPEMRMRAEALGLTAKGKQDRRWRVVAPPEDDGKPAKRKSRYQHLKAVPDVGPGT
jgi:hypothetical protein